MKRRILSILLTACLCLALLPAITTDVHAAGEHVHCDCAGKYKGVGEHTACQDHVWQEWTDELAKQQYYNCESATSRNSLPRLSGYYYLTSDVELSSTNDSGRYNFREWNPGSLENIHLCMNGRKIFQTEKNRPTISIPSGSGQTGLNLTITNCSTFSTPEITRSSNAASDARYTGYGIDISTDCAYELNLFGITIKDHGCGISAFCAKTENLPKKTVNLYGCTITDNGIKDLGYRNCGIYNNDKAGTFNLYATKVQGNKSDVEGGGIWNLGTINLYSGTEVKNNTASGIGGGIYSTGTTTITGASITDNTGSNGGGIYSTGAVTITDTSITGNTANNGGGIFSEGGLRLFGNTTVTGNTANGEKNNLRKQFTYYNSTGDFTVDEGYSGSAGITPKETISLGGKLLIGNTTANAEELAKHFTSDILGYEIEAGSDGKSIYLTNPRYAAKVTSADGTEVTEYGDLSAAITAAQSSTDSTLTLLRSSALSSGLTIDSGSFTLDLNGKTLTSSDGTATLTLSGGSITVKNGTLQNKGSGEGLLVTGDGTLTLGENAAFSSLKLENNQTAADILPVGLAYHNTGTYSNESDVHLKDFETVTSELRIAAQPSSIIKVGSGAMISLTRTSGTGYGNEFWSACGNQDDVWYTVNTSGEINRMTLSQAGSLGKSKLHDTLDFDFSRASQELVGRKFYARVRYYDQYLFSTRGEIQDKDTPTLSGVTASATYTGSGIPATAITGTATFNGNTVSGSWSWKDGKAPKTVADSTSTDKQWYAVFTPTDGTTYYSAEAEVTVTIDPKPVTAKITVTDKTYDTTNTATVSAAVTTEEGLAAGDTITITGLTGTFDNAAAETGKTVTVNASNASISGDDKDNYSVTIPATAQGTINKADQTAPGAPTVKADATTSSKTELTLITTTGFGAVQYAAGTTSAAPTDESAWQTSPVFTGLTKNTQYYFFARYAGDTNHNPSPASTGTANQTLDTYTITYDLNGGSGTAPTAQTQDVGTGFTTAVKDGFDRTGYSFLGWAATESAATASYAAGAAVSGIAANTTLYAVWQPIIYNIDYVLNGGTVSTANPGTYTVETASFTLNNPTRIGYTFAGWTDGSGSDAQLTVTVATGSVGNRTYTATWTAKQYNITYMGMENATHGEKHPETHTYDTATVISNPTKTGYTFNGWKVGGAETPVKDLTLGATDYTAAITLTADWTINQYTITFDTDGGSKIDPITKDYNASVTAPAAPKKAGHTFKGWEPEVPHKMPAENMTVKATWTPDVYTVTLNTNKGKIQEGDVTEYWSSTL